MHLVGYLYEDYHDARSLKQKVLTIFACTQYIIDLCLLSIYLEHLTNTEHTVGPSRSATDPHNKSAPSIFTVSRQY